MASPSMHSPCCWSTPENWAGLQQPPRSSRCTCQTPAAKHFLYIREKASIQVYNAPNTQKRRYEPEFRWKKPENKRRRAAGGSPSAGGSPCKRHCSVQVPLWNPLRCNSVERCRAACVHQLNPTKKTPNEWSFHTTKLIPTERKGLGAVRTLELVQYQGIDRRAELLLRPRVGRKGRVGRALFFPSCHGATAAAANGEHRRAPIGDRSFWKGRRTLTPVVEPPRTRPPYGTNETGEDESVTRSCSRERRWWLMAVPFLSDASRSWG